MVVLETERLFLREFQEQDFDDLHALFGDEEIMRYAGGHKSPDETQKALEAMIGKTGKVIGLWPVIHTESSKLIGRAGFAHSDEGLFVEVSYLLAKEYWGQGLATELLKGLLDYGFAHFPFESVVAFGEQKNPATFRVMEKAEMTMDEDTIYDGKPAKRYSMRRQR
jgi:RimJ/RimL family protein N-acetyltransferase